MYGEDSSGRKVSLLCDEPSTNNTHSPPHFVLHSSHHPRPGHSTSTPKKSSSPSQYEIKSSPVISTETPQLVRVGSVSSQGSPATPSPMTPTYHFDPFEQVKNATAYDPYFRTNRSTYPTIPQTQDPQQPYFHYPSNNDAHMEELYSESNKHPSQSEFTYNHSEPTTPLSTQSNIPAPVIAPPNPNPASNSTAHNATTSKTIKKKYPCPHAVRHSCTDTFTTSGHAARHGKKHTGEKNIRCPTCNKAFTRKDNMKQHERTHKGSTAPATTTNAPIVPQSSESQESHPISTRNRRPRAARSHSSSEPPNLDTNPSDMDIDVVPLNPDFPEELRRDTNGRAVRRAAGLTDKSRSINQSNMSIETATCPKSNLGEMTQSTSGRSEEDGEGESPGLDALAFAATMDGGPLRA
ncbi:hypothetical protein MMC12_000236 [Toensbergia leucococca]|nr:hypothetical protein [Toensbergia leucococca]